MFGLHKPYEYYVSETRLSGKKRKENREIKIQFTHKNSPLEDFYRFYV